MGGDYEQKIIFIYHIIFNISIILYYHSINQRIQKYG